MQAVWAALVVDCILCASSTRLGPGESGQTEPRTMSTLCPARADTQCNCLLAPLARRPTTLEHLLRTKNRSGVGEEGWVETGAPAGREHHDAKWLARLGDGYASIRGRALCSGGTCKICERLSLTESRRPDKLIWPSGTVTRRMPFSRLPMQHMLALCISRCVAQVLIRLAASCHLPEYPYVLRFWSGSQSPSCSPPATPYI